MGQVLSYGRSQAVGVHICWHRSAQSACDDVVVLLNIIPGISNIKLRNIVRQHHSTKDREELRLHSLLPQIFEGFNARPLDLVQVSCYKLCS